MGVVLLAVGVEVAAEVVLAVEVAVAAVAAGVVLELVIAAVAAVGVTMRGRVAAGRAAHENPVVPDKVDARRRHQHRQLLDELEARAIDLCIEQCATR